jgi:hypothetical protein
MQIPIPSAQRLTRTELWTLLGLVLGCRLVALWALPLSDDAFVAFRYARHWAAGQGPVFNPGEAWEPALGSSSIGFAGLLALLLRLGCDPTLVAPALGLACDLASARLLIAILGCRRVACAAALFAFASLPALGQAGAGGTEAPLFTLLVLAATLALQHRRWSGAGLLAALATLLRPEGWLLLALFAARVRLARGELRRFAVPVVLLDGTALVWTLAVYGEWLPRAQPGSASVLGTLSQAFCPQLALLPLLALALFGLTRSFGRGPALALLSLGALLEVAGWIASGARPGAASFHLPLCATCVWLGQGAEGLYRALRSRLPADALELVRARAIACGAVFCCVLYGSLSAAQRETVRERVYAPLQERARAIGRVQPRARILASDIGALGWAWKGSVLDSEGRTWPLARHYADPQAMVHALWPEYLLLSAERRRLEPFLADAELAARYVAVARYSESGARELAPDPERLPQEPVADFLLYRRRDLEDGLSP